MARPRRLSPASPRVRLADRERPFVSSWGPFPPRALLSYVDSGSDVPLLPTGFPAKPPSLGLRPRLGWPPDGRARYVPDAPHPHCDTLRQETAMKITSLLGTLARSPSACSPPPPRRKSSSSASSPTTPSPIRPSSTPNWGSGRSTPPPVRKSNSSPPCKAPSSPTTCWRTRRRSAT